jgi:hypothetical protein
MARLPAPAAPCARGVHGPDHTVGCDSKYCAAWGHLDRGHTPAVEHREPISMAGAKHTGVFRKGLDDSLDDLALVAVILNPDVKLVATHKANPQHNLCHAQSTSYLSRSPNPVADHPSASVGPGQRNSIKTSRATRRRYDAAMHRSPRDDQPSSLLVCWRVARRAAAAAAAAAAGVCSGLAPDVDLVGLKDEIGAPLTVSDESAQERRAQVPHAVHVLDDVGNGHSPHQAMDLTAH